jgi:aspartate racemase
MKALGIVGGIGPESTVVYYRSIVTQYREQKQDGSYPSILLNSIDLTKMLEMIGANQLTEVTDYLVDEVKRLAKAGAAFGLLAAVTPHIVFDEISRRSPIPLISIVDVTCREAEHLGLKKAGLFGTRITMQKSFFPDVFSRAGIKLAAPLPREQDYVQEIYMNELVNGVFLPETHERLLKIVDRMMEQEGIDGLILGGTELPLILKDGAHKGIPFLDTTKIHVKYAVEELLS